MLRDEAGQALALALAVLLLLSMGATTSLYLATRGEKAARLSADRLAADSLAEAGIAFARAVLAESVIVAPTWRIETLPTGVVRFRALPAEGGWSVESVGTTNAGAVARTSEVVPVLARVEEDSPEWDCATDGNLVCGDEAP